MMPDLSEQPSEHGQTPAEAAKAAAAADHKPSARGWIHAITLPVALFAGLVLVAISETPAARWSTAVFAASGVILFGMSALYHRFNWTPKSKAALRRLDHANIFILIAGTYTPMAMLALPFPKSVILLSLVWGGAVIGILLRVFILNTPRWLYVALYLLLGWAAVMYMVDLFTFSPAMAILIIVGGLAYSVGAVAYALKRPNPSPKHFGFHEIFHTLTVVAWGCHWASVLVATLTVSQQ
ncbi:COG1272: Predicted membrane protein hemolysin III homolog [Agrococcus casei LMG 22410]|uniref:COG1272: Predicted membrane protein hemolysin III homolog n=2 Tax=Agrococcus TaxID=46352 RepID=A0A1R4G352_9MICO|nr:COG1272: Predicted membrane protein hemolysin III homolog [Agrococcus casei LMG 22410]